MDHPAPDLTPKQIRLFALMLLAFAALLGLLTWWRGAHLLVAATILSVAWIIALLFSDVDRRSKALGVLLPLLCGAIGGSVYRGVDALTVATAVWIVGGLIALASYASEGIGRTVYVNWTAAAVPIGWSISRAILALVYYGVLTPIGLVMRLFGHDPMRRRTQPDAGSYWIEHEQVTDPRRYFKQF